MSEAKFTKGPWTWEINEKQKEIELCAGNRIEVLRFQRWGMQSAMPTFINHKDDTFLIQGVKATSLSEPIKGREHHAHWCKTINHPDAHLIAAAPKLYEMLKNVSSELYQMIDEVNDQRLANSHPQAETPPDLVDMETLHLIELLLAEARGEQCK